MSTASPRVLVSPPSTASAHHRSQPSRRSAPRRWAPRFRELGSTVRLFNAATASRARSCLLQRFWRLTRTLRIPISTPRCPATSAAVGPIAGYARQSSRPQNRTEREADNDPRTPHIPSHPPASTAVDDRSLPAHLLAGRSSRGRRAVAEPELAVRQRQNRSD